MASFLTYTIDPDDRIEAIGGEWDEFARENGAPHLTRESVLGTVLWAHIRGADARHLHTALVEGARRRRRVVVPFRCDAPDRRRYMELMGEGDGGWVHFTSRLVHEELRPPIRIVAGDGRGAVEICTQCRRIRTSSGWREIERAIQHLDLYRTEEAPRMVESVCTTCREVVRLRVGT